MAFPGRAVSLSLVSILINTYNVAGDGFLRRQELSGEESSPTQRQQKFQEESDLWERLLQTTFGSMEAAATTPPVPTPTSMPPTTAPIPQSSTPLPTATVTEAETPLPTIPSTTAAPTVGTTAAPTVAPTVGTTATPTVAPTVGATAAPTVGICENLLWSDEFNSDGINNAPNEAVWSFDLGNGMDGWGNLELQEYTSNPENVRVQDGTLIITAAAEDIPEGGRSFTSGRIRTEDKLEVLYGNIEARIKIPTIGNGLWPAFWALGGNHREVGWPSSGEIDILEMGSGEAIAEGVVHRRVTSAFHREVRGNQASITGTLDLPADLNDGEFHIFRSEWTSNRIATYVDDNLILEMDITEGVCSDCSEFHQPHFLILNVAFGGYFTGILEEAGVTAPLPAEMIVDYVRVCDNGETVLSGSTMESQTNFAFDCGAPAICTASALNNYADGAICGARILSLMENGMSEVAACRQVAGTEYPAQCGQCVKQVLDCGLETCNDEALDSDAAGLTCRARISFLIGVFGHTEREACNRVGGREHPSECGACNPIDCDQPEICTEDVLNANAGGPTCLERIKFLIESGSSELDACKQVAGVEFTTECGPCDVIDCDRPRTCTTDVLNTDAGGFTCQERISFLISSEGMSEADACQRIAGVEFPGECGQCVEDSLDCGVPETCTRAVLDADADGFSCKDRIEFLIGSMGFSVQDACNQIGTVEFPTQCGPCASGTSIDCGIPETCTDAVLAADAGGFPCGDRISFLMSSSGLDETAACSQVGDEFPLECSGCDPSS